MKNDPMKLLSKRTVVIRGIVPNPINTNINFGVYRLTLLGEVKSDDICKEIMLQIFLVNAQEVGIRAKDVLEFSQLPALLFYHFANKLF